jgi:putative sugar O-methyltransferase
MLSTIKSWILRFLLALGYRVERVPPTIDFGLGRIRRFWKPVDPALRRALLRLDEFSGAPDLPPLGDRWGAYAARLRATVRRLSSIEELILFGQSQKAGVETQMPPHQLSAYCQSADLQMAAHMPRHLYESFQSFRSPRVVSPEHSVQYRGRTMDFVTLSAAQTVVVVLNLLKDEIPRSICDIGGGTGKFALSWLVNGAHKADLVAIIDIPETLIYSEALLRSELGDAFVQYISSPADVPNRSGIVLCPIANARALEDVSFDLVTNTHSMQEMTDAWVDWYMAWLDRQPCRFFWSSNFFANPISNMAEGHNSWSPRPSPSWQMIYSVVAVGTRNSANMLFRKDDDHRAPEVSASKGIEGWLAHLDAARCLRSEPSLRRALEFSRSELPFVPKEAWQVAKMLSAITDSAQDRDVFCVLDSMRRTGVEAAH